MSLERIRHYVIPYFVEKELLKQRTKMQGLGHTKQKESMPVECDGTR
jgi:hypothetical protein